MSDPSDLTEHRSEGTRPPRDRRRTLGVVAGLVVVGAIAWLFLDSAPAGLRGRGAGESPSAAGPSQVVGPGEVGSDVALAGRAKTPTRSPDATVGGSVTSRSAPFRGIVVDATGAPMPGVLVRASGRGLGVIPPVAAGPDGRFAFDADAEAAYLDVRARATGLVTKGSEVTLDRKKEGRIVLVAACPLKVRVLDAATGAAVRDTAVRAISGIWVNVVTWSRLECAAADEATTDATGVATLATEGGPALVCVMPKDHAATLVRGVNVPSEGTEIEVRVVRGGVVAGTAKTGDGKPIAGAHVRLDVRPCYRRETTADGEGRFRLEAVPAGDPGAQGGEGPDAVLTVDAPGFVPGVASLAPPSPGETRVKDVTLDASWRLPGRVVGADGRPAPGVRLRLERDDEDGFWVGGDLLTVRAVSDAEGRFVLDAVGPGEWELWATSAEGRVRTSERRTFAKGTPPDPFEVVLPDLSGRVTVDVVDVDGAPVEGAVIELKIATRFVTDSRPAGATDARGRLEITGVPRTGVGLLVSGPQGVPLSRPLTPDELGGQTIRVALGGREIAGRALQLDGRPARVRLRLESHIGACSEQGPLLATDADGGFRFRQLVDGAYLLDLDSEAEGTLVGDTGPRAGTKDLVVYVAGSAEVARLHPQFLLRDAATGEPVPVPAFEAFARLLRDGRNDPGAGPGMPHGPESSPDGRFLGMGPVVPGTYDVVITVPGYRSARRERMRFPWAGDPPVVALEKGAEISGVVLDAEGKPIEDVHVQVQGRAATTDARGAYRVAGLEEGRVEVSFADVLILGAMLRAEVPAAGSVTLDARLERRGALRVVFAGVDGPSTRGALRIRVIPPGGGAAVERAAGAGDSGSAETGGEDVFGGLVAGRYRVVLLRDGVELPAFPAQDVEVVVGAAVEVRFAAR